jgi:hypothetical protein
MKERAFFEAIDQAVRDETRPFKDKIHFLEQLVKQAFTEGWDKTGRNRPIRDADWTGSKSHETLHALMKDCDHVKAS